MTLKQAGHVVQLAAAAEDQAVAVKCRPAVVASPGEAGLEKRSAEQERTALRPLAGCCSCFVGESTLASFARSLLGCHPTQTERTGRQVASLCSSWVQGNCCRGKEEAASLQWSREVVAPT